MFVTLRGCRFDCNGYYSWWNNDRRFWLTLGNGVQDALRHRRREDTVLLIEPFALAVNLQTGAVEQQMQWPRAVNSLRQNRQTATAAAQCGVIGDGDVDLEHVGDRSQQTLGLSRRLVEYEAQREACRGGIDAG